MEEGGVKHLLKTLVRGQFVKYWPIVRRRTTLYRSDAEEIGRGIDTELLSELRKKNYNTGPWRKGTQRARSPEVGGKAESDVIETRA